MRLIALSFASMILLVSASQRAEMQLCNPTFFSSFNDRDQTPDFARTAAAAASYNRIAILVFTGNDELGREVYRAAQSLRAEGIPLSIILATSLDPSNSSAAIQVYARSVPVYEGYGAIIGARNLEFAYTETVRGVRSAHQRHGLERCSE